MSHMARLCDFHNILTTKALYPFIDEGTGSENFSDLFIFINPVKLAQLDLKKVLWASNPYSFPTHRNPLKVHFFWLLLP